LINTRHEYIAIYALKSKNDLHTQDGRGRKSIFFKSVVHSTG